MKKFLIASALVLGAWSGSAQAVTTIEFNGGSGVPTVGTFVFQNFESFASNSAIGPNAVATNNSTNLTFRPAFGSTGNFAAVLDGGSFTTLFGPTNVFSFVLGSLDAFNVLTLRYTDGTTQVLAGGAIVNNPALNTPGDRTAAQTNGVVTYRVTSGALLSGATFASSGGNSFEFDNLSAAVPEPAAWGMMILGFGLVGGSLRRRQTSKVAFA